MMYKTEDNTEYKELLGDTYVQFYRNGREGFKQDASLKVYRGWKNERAMRTMDGRAFQEE